MKTRLLCLFLALFGSIAPVSAIPDVFIINGNGNFVIPPVIPAMPRFNADLTRPFLDAAAWQEGEFPGPWEQQPGLGDEEVRRMTASPVLFGAVPQAVYAYGQSGQTRQLAITYLDAGEVFGFKLGGEKTGAERRVGGEKRANFDHLFGKLTRNLTTRLHGGCGPPRLTTIGRSNMLRTVYKDYRWEGFILRLAVRAGHSVALHILREETAFDSFADGGILKMNGRERGEKLAENVRFGENGDLWVDGIPMFGQGNTPYCGIHSLAMVGHYLGLRIPVRALAGSAGLRNNGSARGANIMGLYYAAAEEVNLQVRLSGRFDARKVQKSLQAGLPVVVWRRVSLEREKARAEFAAKFAKNPALRLPEPNQSQRNSWPPRDKKGSPSHASIVSGLNLDRNEAILTEPWGEHARGRRIRLEELEATTYAAFYFRLES